MSNKETITVGVITFNSSTTVLETLESIKNQTYGSKFIELGLKSTKIK